MKNAILTALLICFSISGIAQTKEKIIGVSKQYGLNDTTRTFTIMIPDTDKCIAVLIEKWGTPDTKSAGKIIWNSKKLDGFDEEIMIVIKDGIFQIKENCATFRPFNSEEQKIKKLAALETNESRNMEIKFVNSERKNIINSYKLERQIINILEQDLKDLR